MSNFFHYPVCLRLSTSLISLSLCLWRSLSLCSLIWSNDRMSFFSLLLDLRSRLLELWRRAKRRSVGRNYTNGPLQTKVFEQNQWNLDTNEGRGRVESGAVGHVEMYTYTLLAFGFYADDRFSFRFVHYYSSLMTYRKSKQLLEKLTRMGGGHYF